MKAALLYVHEVGPNLLHQQAPHVVGLPELAEEAPSVVESGHQHLGYVE